MSAEISSPFGAFSLLPPVVAIALALATRQVHLALLTGVFVGALVWVGGNPLVGLRETGNLVVEVFQSPSNTMVLLFCLLVGGLIALIQRSGGVVGFIEWLERRRVARTRPGAQMLAWLIGLLIFVESSITCLVVGAVSRPLFDRMRISREKLAYICDSTSAPVCMLFPLNGWGALIIGLLTVQLVEDPVSVLIYALPLTFYGLLTVLMVPLVIWLGDFGPMKAAEKRAREEGKLLADGAFPMMSEEISGLQPKPGLRPRALHLLFPILVMVSLIPVGLYVTGEGDPLAGSGSTSVFWAVSLAVLSTGVLLLLQRIFSLSEVVDLVLKGSAGLLSVSSLVLLAFALGIVSGKLMAGEYVAGLLQSGLSPAFLPFLVFAAAAFVSFSTGSSWGTFAILVPIAVTAAGTLEVSLPLVLGAVLSGGIFGDHASPLSDTTIISSLAAASDHIDHVNTQLPYALLAAGLAGLLYLLAGWMG